MYPVPLWAEALHIAGIHDRYIVLKNTTQSGLENSFAQAKKSTAKVTVRTFRAYHATWHASKGVDYMVKTGNDFF